MEHEISWRIGGFIGFFCIFAIWEKLAPRRRMMTSRAMRWLSNLAIVIINSAIVRMIFPFAAVGMATIAEQRGWGLLNNLPITDHLAGVVALILLDLAIYLQHVMFHAVPLFWRLHMVHHSDMDFDVTTGVRFHPLEILLSMVIKFAVIVALGPAPLATLIFEAALNATAMFNHANIRLPLTLDRLLRWIVVTPDMHRVHHSVSYTETNSNFGFNLPWWDRLLGTYRDQPAAAHDGMTIGLVQFRDPAQLTLTRLVLLPFVARGRGYAIGERANPADE